MNSHNLTGNCGTAPTDSYFEVDDKVCALRGEHEWGMNWFILGACGQVTGANGWTNDEYWSIDERYSFLGLV